MARIPNTNAGRIDDAGVIPSAKLAFASQPTDGDTLTIGADVYEFVNTAINTTINSDTHIAVVIGASAAATLTNLVAAINATDADNLHATVKLADTVTPAKANGTEPVFADTLTTNLRIQYASSPGGAPKPGAPSIVLAEGITAAGDIWNVGAVNLNTLSGAAVSRRLEAKETFTVTAAMGANGYSVVFPFSVDGFVLFARASTGGIRAGAVGDTANASGTSINLVFSGGVAPAWQAGDLITVVAWSA